ncbi:MAG: hypothetical protein HC871_16765 [Rhizobiales bacterium]|nr:hypothetical protein [Hyphomicrobiales bacterium]
MTLSLPASAWQDVTWRTDVKGDLASRCTARRRRPAPTGLRLGDDERDAPWPERRLLIEWPEDEGEPTKFWCADLPAETSPDCVVHLARLRSRIEPDDLEPKLASGEALERRITNGLKPFIATQRVRHPPGKGGARQPEASLAWAAATSLVKRRQRALKPCGSLEIMRARKPSLCWARGQHREGRYGQADRFGRGLGAGQRCWMGRQGT